MRQQPVLSSDVAYLYIIDIQNEAFFYKMREDNFAVLIEAASVCLFVKVLKN